MGHRSYGAPGALSARALSDLVRVEIPGVWAEGAPPRFTGRALNGWFYAQIEARDPDLAAELHQDDDVKPYTLALVDGNPGRLIVSGYGPLFAPVLDLGGRVGRLLLDACWWDAVDEPRWTIAAWDHLAGALLAPDPPSSTRLAFRSPTTFHRRGLYVPLPAPEWLFAGLLARWRRWSPIDPGEEADAALASIALGRFHCTGVAVQTAGLMPSFVGWAEYRMVRPAEGYAGLLGMLAQFAPFAGVGHKVGQGLGSVERVFPRRRTADPPPGKG